MGQIEIQCDHEDCDHLADYVVTIEHLTQFWWFEEDRSLLWNLKQFVEGILEWQMMLDESSEAYSLTCPRCKHKPVVADVDYAHVIEGGLMTPIEISTKLNKMLLANVVSNPIIPPDKAYFVDPTNKMILGGIDLDSS